MRVYSLTLIIFICTLLLAGCISNVKSSLVSKEQGQLDIYVIYFDNEQMYNSPMKEEVMNIVYEHSKKVMNVTSMYAETEDIIREFEIKEFPTILVFDTENIVLKTTESDKLEDLLSK